MNDRKNIDITALSVVACFCMCGIIAIALVAYCMPRHTPIGVEEIHLSDGTRCVKMAGQGISCDWDRKNP